MGKKFDNIINSGKKDGLSIDKEIELELTHRVLIEGVPFYIFNELKEKLMNFEKGISEQPMLLAHPSNIEKKKLLNFLESSYIKTLVENDFVMIDKPIYDMYYSNLKQKRL